MIKKKKKKEKNGENKQDGNGSNKEHFCIFCICNLQRDAGGKKDIVFDRLRILVVCTSSANTFRGTWRDKLRRLEVEL
jgi:hypothetical protein